MHSVALCVLKGNFNLYPQNEGCGGMAGWESVCFVLKTRRRFIILIWYPGRSSFVEEIIIHLADVWSYKFVIKIIFCHLQKGR